MNRLAGSWFAAIIASIDGRLLDDVNESERGVDELIYYVNGEYVPAAEGVLPLSDLGIVRGYGVFDLLRTYGPVPFRLREHLLRLQSSCRQIGLDLPWSLDELEAIVTETYARNDNLPDASIRIVVTGGVSANFMTPQQHPSLAVMITPVTPYAAQYYRDGCKVVTTRIERIMPTVKSLNYIGAIMAMKEAAAVDAVEAIYMDRQGHVTEGTRSNLFMLKDGVLVTPTEGVLPGITRQVVLDVAAQEYTIVERDVPYASLPEFDEIFLTSTTKEVLPVVKFDSLTVGDGRPGPHTRRIATLFKEHVGNLADALAT